MTIYILRRGIRLLKIIAARSINDICAKELGLAGDYSIEAIGDTTEGYMSYTVADNPWCKVKE